MDASEPGQSAERDVVQQTGKGNMPVHTGSGDMHIYMSPPVGPQLPPPPYGPPIPPPQYRQGPGPQCPPFPPPPPYRPVRPPGLVDQLISKVEAQLRSAEFRRKMFANRWWYLVVPVVTLGFGAWVPFVHAAWRQRRPVTYLAAAGFFVLSLIQCGFVLATPRRGENPNPSAGAFNAVYLIALVASACVLLFFLRRQTPASRVPAAVPGTTDSVAVATPSSEGDVPTGSAPLADLKEPAPSPRQDSVQRASTAKTAWTWVGRIVMWLAELVFLLAVIASIDLTVTGEWATPRDYIGGTLCFGIPFLAITTVLVWDARRMWVRRRARDGRLLAADSPADIVEKP